MDEEDDDDDDVLDNSSVCGGVFLVDCCWPVVVEGVFVDESICNDDEVIRATAADVEFKSVSQQQLLEAPSNPEGD